MNRFTVITRIGSDGVLHLNYPVGVGEAGAEVQVTVEPVGRAAAHPLTASELLNSGLVGIWADRPDVGESLEFARRLRTQGETRRHDP